MKKNLHQINNIFKGYNLFYLLILILFFSIGCKGILYNKYGNCTSKVNIREQCPFVLIFQKDSIKMDTLFYSATIVNISDSVQVISVFPFVNLNIYKHPYLQLGNQVGDRNVYTLNKCSNSQINCITCNNCFKYYSNTYPFMGLKKNESYKVSRKQHIQNLGKLKQGDIFFILGYWYIPDYLEPYCPRIWTGTISTINEIKL